MGEKPKFSLTARQKLITKLGLAIVSGTFLVGSCAYAINHQNDFLLAPKHNLIALVNESNLLNEDDRLYLLQSNASKLDVEKAMPIFDTYVLSRASPEKKLEHTISEVLQTDPGKLGYVMDALVQNAGANTSLELCEANVFPKAGQGQQLDYLMKAIEKTNPKNYGQLAGAMLNRVGTDLYQTLKNLLEGR